MRSSYRLGRITALAVWVTAWGLSGAAPAAAQDAAGEDAQALAKKLSNPVSDMVSVPFQYNWENGVGPDHGLRTVLNIQPVVPVTLNDHWSVIGRWIMPYVSQPEFLGLASGFSDIVFSAFFAPSGGSSFIWGAGPVFSLPMTSDPALGSGKWSAGPTVVVLKMAGPWIYGMLWNQLWSFGDTSDLPRTEVNQGFFQPFLAYCSATGVTYTLQSESNANWQAPNSSDTWTIPINVLVSKVTKFGPFPLSVAAGAGVYVASPDGGPDWKLRAAFTVMLPRKK